MQAKLIPGFVSYDYYGVRNYAYSINKITPVILCYKINA